MFRGLWNALLLAMTSWHQSKLFVEHSVAMSHDSLHIIVGALLWLAFGLLLRRPLTFWRPWLGVLVFILWNETVDLSLEQWPDPGWQYGESAKDLILTLSMPTLMMAAARLRPDLFRGRVGRRR
jgi:hypothetical protein